MKETKHCCELMDYLLSEGKIAMQYCPVFREYYIKLTKDIAVQGIRYCPWCAAKLPSSLRDEFFELVKEYNIRTISEVDAAWLPEEFKTDEWWKKRGL